MAKIAIVTGASRGIGAATAVMLGKSGYSVCVNYVKNELAAQGVVESIVCNGGIAFAHRANVSEPSEVEKLFATVDQRFGPLTALVNNAGILETQQRVVEMDLRRLQRVFATNVFGTILCAREAIRRMALGSGGGGGAIVNVSSVAARTGAPNEYVDYAASKGAVDSFTIGLAKEVAGEGIRVNGVRPALIYTDIHAAGGEPGRVERVKANVPMRRGGHANEVAEAIVWLLSEKASYATGTLLDIAGGL